MDHLDALIALLEKDARRNVNVLHFIAANPVLGMARVGDSVLVRGRSDRPWVFVSSADQEELAALVGELGAQDDHFAAIEDWMVPILTAGKEVVWDLSMIQFVLPDDVRLPESEHTTCPLSVTDARRVYETSAYRDVLSRAYVKDRILRGPSVSIHEGGQPVAWAMTQDDGAMGFLHVLERYRGQGYGRAVALALANALRKRGQRPFAYIEEDNHRAIRLVTKLGFERDKRVHWLRIRPDGPAASAGGHSTIQEG